MKDSLDPKSRQDLVNYRLVQSKDTLIDATILAAAGRYNSSVNRLYYAAYYAACALMICNGLEATSHKGTRVMLNLKFVQTGLLESEFGKIYQRLFNQRQAGDYEEFVYHDKDTYDTLYPQTAQFIERIISLIRSK